MTAESNSWRTVSKEEFFATVGRLDVHPRIVGRWPYTSFWEDSARRSHGKSSHSPTRYFVPAKMGDGDV